MQGIGYGKVILFGEHFVVYGKEAIVSGLPGLRTIVDIEESNKWDIISNVDNDDAINAFIAITNALDINKAFKVKVIESVPVKQNLGSSAALNVAFVNALNNLYNLKLSEEELNKLAYKGEVIFHGTPSGIDNSAALYGKPLLFKKLNNNFKIKPINKSMPLHLLIVNTGFKTKGTAELVEQVRILKESYKVYEKYAEFYDTIKEKAIEALTNDDIKELGILFNINHSLLSAFGLSTHLIEEARYMLKYLGALGSKITGAGGGGNIIALFNNKEQAIRAGLILEEYGFKSFYTKI